MTTSTTAAPVITVIMSCYNSARWLDDAINSVLNQTYKDFEFVIVDDGSKDVTLEIIQRHAQRDTRIVIVAKSNTGLADSLNVGIQKARGEWIARIDADDICEPTRLKKQIELSRANPELVFIGTGVTEIDQHGNRLKVYHYPSRHTLLLKHLRTVRNFPPHSSAFFPTRVVRAVGGYRPRIRRAQDCDLWLRLSELGELACIHEPLVRIRKHADQTSHDESGRRQKIDSRVAMTSYWLRLNGGLDPVSDDETHFDAFHAWIEKRLNEEDLFAAEDLRKQLRNVFYGAPNSLVGALKIIGTSLKRPAIVLRLILQRFFGENLARQLAREWTNGASSSASS